MSCGGPLAPLDETALGFIAPAPQPRFRGTMIGLAPPTVAQPPAHAASPGAPPTPPPPTGAEPTPYTRPAAPKGGHRQTMIGIAPLSPSSQTPPPASSGGPDFGYPTPPPPPDIQPAPVGAGGTLPHIAPNQKTMLGVARPGIAPLNPGQAKAASTALPMSATPHTGPAQAPSAQFALIPSELLSPPAVRTSRNDARPKPGIPALAAVAMVSAAGLFAAAAVVWLFYRGHGSIEAQASALPDGKEQLELNCAACDDGTLTRLDAAKTTFTAHRATLPLSRPLKVGENSMTITLVSPRGKQSFVDISVPIAFRVRGDTSGLEAPTPELRVLVSAIVGSNVTVDGKPLTLNADGEGRYAIDVSADVTGLDPNIKPLERKVPYVVTPPNAVAHSGTVTLQASITPLVIEAPGPSVVLESSNFVLSGRTAKAGALTVGDRPITVDPAGRFAQMMNVSAAGETTIIIRATSKDTAPRLFPLRVKRVDSLTKEAERVRQRATSNYAALADRAETKRGWAVALDGTAVDARSENYHTVIVMEVQGGCAKAPCLARITYGAPFSVSRGDKLSAYGEVAGVVDGPRSGTRIPDVRADFLIRASK